MPTTRGSDTNSSQCSPRYHQFSPTRHLCQRSQGQLQEITLRILLFQVLQVLERESPLTCRWRLFLEECHIYHRCGRSPSVLHRCSDRAARLHSDIQHYKRTPPLLTSDSPHTGKTHCRPGIYTDPPSLLKNVTETQGGRPETTFPLTV